jgi:hypothetical protein
VFPRLTLVFLVLAAATACVSRPRVILPGNQYKILQLRGRSVTLAPPASSVGVDEPLLLHFPVALGASPSNCLEANELFKIQIDRKTRQLTLTLPSLNAWQLVLPQWEQPDRGDVHDKLMAILEAPKALETRGCLSPGSAVALRQVLREAIPVRPGFDLYPKYGYGPGGLGFELRPGVRLKVQRAHFNGPPPPDGKRGIQDFFGISAVFYDCQLDNGDRIAFAKPVVQYDSDALKTRLAKGWEDTQFARDAKPQPLYRLYLLTSFLKTGVKRSALVIGGATVTQMLVLEREIAANPAISCDDLKAAACLSFEGDVTVSAEVAVKVNGETAYFDMGTNVRAVLRKYQAEKAVDVRLRRAFQGKLLPFEIDPKAADGLENTALVAGDELTWKPMAGGK